MDFENFKQEIRDLVEDLMGDAYIVSLERVQRNNGVMLNSMVIRRSGEHIVPNLYLESWYQLCRSGVDITEIAHRIIREYHRSVLEMPFDIDVVFSNKTLKENVVYRLINADRNRELLERIPHIPFLDLALVYYCIIHTSQNENGAILVSYDNLRLWGVEESELDHFARENTQKLLPADFVGIAKLLEEFSSSMEEHTYAALALEEEQTETPLYVLTNSERHFGSCYMADMKVLSGISEKLADDFYILPSSVHECMVLPVSMADDPETLQAMVQDINRTQVQEDEYLADSVYLYSRQTGTVKIAA